MPKSTYWKVTLYTDLKSMSYEELLDLHKSMYMGGSSDVMLLEIEREITNRKESVYVNK